jgi:hypothetical protein
MQRARVRRDHLLPARVRCSPVSAGVVSDFFGPPAMSRSTSSPEDADLNLSVIRGYLRAEVKRRSYSGEAGPSWPDAPGLTAFTRPPGEWVPGECSPLT